MEIEMSSPAPLHSEILGPMRFFAGKVMGS